MTEMTLERKEGRSWLRRFGDRWGARDLVVIGVFAATAKLSTVLIAMVGGGMNPVSLLLKNVVFTTLLVVMLYKVRQPGTLSLFVIVSALVNFLLLGGNVTLIPPMLVAALVSEAVMKFVKSLGWKGAVFWGVGCFDFLSKGLSLARSVLSHDARISGPDGSCSPDRFDRLCRFFNRSLYGLPFNEGIKTCRHRPLLNLMF